MLLFTLLSKVNFLRIDFSPILSLFAFKMDNFTCYLCQVPFLLFFKIGRAFLVSPAIMIVHLWILQSSNRKKKNTLQLSLILSFPRTDLCSSSLNSNDLSTMMSTSFPTSYLASRYLQSYCLCSHLSNLYISCAFCFLSLTTFLLL